MTTLKLCAHCKYEGSVETIRSTMSTSGYRVSQYAITCSNCKCGTPFFHEQEQAEKLWNSRTPEDSNPPSSTEGGEIEKEIASLDIALIKIRLDRIKIVELEAQIQQVRNENELLKGKQL